MSRTYLDFLGGLNASKKGSSAAAAVACACDGISGAKSGIDSKILNRNNVSGQILSVENEARVIATTIEAIVTSVQAAIERYSSTEGRIYEYVRQVTNPVSVNASTSVGAGMSNLDRFKKTTKIQVEQKIGNTGTVGIATPAPAVKTWKDRVAEGFATPDYWKAGTKPLSKFGTGGAILGNAIDLTNAIRSGKTDKIGKELLNSGKTYTTVFGTLAENAWKKEAPSTKSVLWGDFTKGGAVAKFTKDASGVLTKGSTFHQALQKEVSSYAFSSAKNVGENIKVGTKWAGVVFSGAVNTISNIEEQKKNPSMSNARVVAETIVETAWDIGIGMLATAATTAAIGASAPAVVVGAVAVGAVWLANAATEGITSALWGKENKKNLTELASDAIIDLSVAAGKEISKGFNAVVSWGKSLFS